MTPQFYKKAYAQAGRNDGQGICHPVKFGKDEREDYEGNEDLPFVYKDHEEQRSIDVLNYYYFWFPLVKGSLK